MDNGYVCGNHTIEREVVRNTETPRTLRYIKHEKIIFPYTYNENELVHYDDGEFERLYPGATAYLNEFRDDLDKRQSDNNAKWYEYGRSQALSGLNRQKLLISTVVTNDVDVYELEQECIPYAGMYIVQKDWKQYGVQISRTALANWIIYCSKNYFQPMYDYFHRELLKRSFAMADETRVQVLKEEGRGAQTQSFMWLFRSGEDGLAEIILYGYSPTRSGSHAKEFLEGYSGYLETDGYQGYNSLPGIRRCSCWAHIRRYFIDAVPKGKQYDYSQPAVQGVQYCNRLFAMEDSINKKYPGNYEKRKQLRLEKEKPVLEAFWSWLDQQKPVRNTRLDKAVNYVLNRRDIAETYLEDGRCSFTNNLSENAIRPFAVGRKNWLFSSSVDGANASAVVYTMVEMAKAHGLNIYGYLKFLLENRPSKNMTDEQLAELAPWSEKLQSIKNRM